MSYQQDDNALNELYQDLILDHSKNPRCLGALEAPDATARGYNPLCGDQITLYVKIKDDRIADISFTASGCAISVASASLMSELLKGKSIDEAQQRFGDFHQLVTDGSGSSEGLGDIEALAGVRQFPIRIKCATLAWHALREALATGSAAAHQP